MKSRVDIYGRPSATLTAREIRSMSQCAKLHLATRSSHSSTLAFSLSGLQLPIERPLRLNPYGEFCRRLFYDSLHRGLRAGRVSTNINGKTVSVADARQMVLPRGGLCVLGAGRTRHGSGRVLQDHIRAFFADHYDSCVGISGYNGGHD
jgi:hypothetical protein